MIPHQLVLSYLLVVVASIFGVGLITKKYMNDPEALREYLQGK